MREHNDESVEKENRNGRKALVFSSPSYNQFHKTVSLNQFSQAQLEYFLILVCLYIELGCIHPNNIYHLDNVDRA